MEKKLNVSGSMTPAVSVPLDSVEKRELGKKRMKEFMKEELRTVKGIFQFFETPGGSTKVSCLKYPGVPMFEKYMTDGQEYEVPLYVARFLNGIDVTAEAIGGKLNTCGYVKHQYLMDMHGSPLIASGKVKRRFGFQSLEFSGNKESAA